MVFLVKLICTPEWGGEGHEVQMEKCLAVEAAVEVIVVVGGWDIRGESSRC